jgi:RNA 2',3'-cyclic 3'-phosphodiesterase
MDAAPAAGPRGEDRVRAFVALPVSEPLKIRLGDLMRDLAPGTPGIRFVRPEGVHLTLRFLGWTSPEQVRVLEPRLRQAAAACPKGEAHVAGLGLFPDRGSPQVLWIGLRLPEPVLALQMACEAAAVAAGFAPENRRFRAHLTLGRWKDRARRPELPPADLGALPIEELVLFRSDLRQSGAIHTPLARYPLGT